MRYVFSGVILIILLFVGLYNRPAVSVRPSRVGPSFVRARAVPKIDAPKKGVEHSLTVSPLDITADANARVHAVFVLSEKGAAATPELLRIIAEPMNDPDHRRSVGVTVRIMALEALDRLAANGTDVKEQLALTLAEQTDPTLRMLTLVALSGMDRGQPGKLNRFIDAELDPR